MRTKGSTKELTKHDNVIVPHLSDIKQWIMEGITNRQICERLELPFIDMAQSFVKDIEFLKVILMN